MSERPEKKKIAWTLWIPVILAFLLVITAWTMLIKIARDHPVEPVELEGNNQRSTLNAQD
jgi:cell division septal protein FtsQ